MRRLRLVFCLICALALVVFTAACADTGAGDGADAEAPQETDTTVTDTDADASQEPPALAGEPAPELDLKTLRADTPAGTVEAERTWENTYVGAVDEDLYISVSFSENADTGEPREVTVYLCDGEIGEYLTGEVGAGTNTLEGEVFDVELSLVDDAVTGMVIQDGEEPQPFTANKASGDAGLYTAEFTFEGDEYRAQWIVLPDGSQRGVVCWPCGTTWCCEWVK